MITNSNCHINNPCNGCYGKCLDVKITNACNGSCGFCIEAGGYRPESVSVERLIRATNSLQDYQKVLILGGEPFMYPNLIEYLEGIKEKQEIYITTNGTLFHRWPLEIIAKYLTAINISIHYPSNAGNTSVIGALTDFAEIYKAIQIFKNAGVKVRINTNLIKGVLNNKLDVMLMMNMAKNLNADEIRFSELQHCPDLFVSAKDLFGDMVLPEMLNDPFTFGCEQLVLIDDGFKVWLRLACGLVNPHRAKPIRPARNGSMTKVLYPDGTISDGWLKKDALSKSANKTASCHNDSCH